MAGANRLPNGAAARLLPVPEWDRLAVYQAGDEVSFSGFRFRALVESVGCAPVSVRRGPRSHVWRRL